MPSDYNIPFDYDSLSKPRRITSEQAEEMIDTRQPLGLFWLKDGGWYVGIDNRTGDAWTEEFRTRKKCIWWLLREE